ncbi:hypothetical protein IFM89_022265 [Coptis chinensis]|uniref:Vacuolar iron transporter n=1 Tax=Coptis chinensis TaxID=261450 RepID=A0A835HGC6_9MAGN|nr:hypothetical protein IFM89_022265 [Coptis chinensis]
MPKWYNKRYSGLEQCELTDAFPIALCQWLRAAILSSNDGLLSTTSLMLGMAAASKDRWDMILVGVVATVACACSMAVGEYVSLATQRDIEGMNTNSMLVLLTLASPAKKNQGKEATNQKRIRLCNITWRIAYCERDVTGNGIAIYVVSEVSIDEGDFRGSEGRAVTTDNDYETLPNTMKVACASGLAFLCGSLLPLLSIMIATDINRVLKLVILKLR